GAHRRARGRDAAAAAAGLVDRDRGGLAAATLDGLVCRTGPVCVRLSVSVIFLLVRILISAAFLSGVYGAFGKAAAMTSLVAVALIVEVVALLPIVQFKFLMSRAGRRAYGVSGP